MLIEYRAMKRGIFMQKKFLIASLVTSTLIVTSALLAVAHNRLDLVKAGTGETNTFTLTKANLTNHSWEDAEYVYTYELTGSSLHHGNFTNVATSSESYVYGNFGTEEGVDFTNPDNIFIAYTDTYKTGGSAAFGFRFNFSGITSVNSCTYTYEVDGVENTGFAYVDGYSVYDYYSIENGHTSLALVSISISYNC